MTMPWPTAIDHPTSTDATRRAAFVRRSLWVLAGAPLLAITLIYFFPSALADILLVLLALASPWVFAFLSWRYGSRHARRARWFWSTRSYRLSLLGLAVALASWYLVKLGKGFSKG